jgi:pyridoxamine 5'-phosphate oxidase
MDLFSACGVQSAFGDDLPGDPMPLLHLWLEEAAGAAATPNPDAMVLATTGEGGEPTARVVLCKQIDVEQGFLVFYTNYDSRKARELAGNPVAAATFHWDHAGRQARIVGQVARLPDSESDAYFATRPVLSQLGAWASRQSEPLYSREELMGQIAATMLRFNIDIEQVISGTCQTPIPRPPNWGGYRLWVRSSELWSGGAGRLHERVLWTRRLIMPEGDGEALPQVSSGWQSTRLQP